MKSIASSPRPPFRANRSLVCIALVAAGLVPAISMAQPGQNSEPWSAQPADRAGLAVALKQADGGFPSANGSGGSTTQLVCGGGTGTASATANSTCIILNNSTGEIDVGQGSRGDQTATSSESTSTVAGKHNSLSSALGGLVPGGGN